MSSDTIIDLYYYIIIIIINTIMYAVLGSL